ncbi:MAG: valine--tRNA ligase [Nanoarchaeota archaeon]
MGDKYDFKQEEPKWLRFWEAQNLYKFDEKSKKKVYSIDTPPPYKSGHIHLGHAFSYSQQDFIVRFKRMRGFNVFYPWGTDDNGLPTERFVEKKFNVKSTSMSRHDFIALCKKTVDEMDEEFTFGWRRLGVSAYFKKSYSTIDEWCRKTSQRSFVDLVNKKLAYQLEAPTMWCVHCQTALAQAELEDKELDSTFNDVQFELENKEKITIATTRPELIPACVFIYVHPEDARYKKLVGKKAIVPLFKHKVPIFADESANPEKGSGILMVCSYGDKYDAEAVKKRKIEPRLVLTRDGKMNKLAGKYEGLKIKEARNQILNDLEAERLLLNKKQIKHAVNVHERCGTEIEFLTTKQWFIKLLENKQKFIDSGRKINWYPEFMRSRYEKWVEGLGWDWCISRQRHYGVPIPVWYCKKCGELKLPNDEQLPIDPKEDKPKTKCKCGSDNFEGEQDVFDTWATSSLTPQIISKWKENDSFFKKTYPNDLRPQAHDIIRTWAFYTIVKSLYHDNSIPWKNIIVSGYLLAGKEKMSKSKGNVINPLETIDKFGSDALRFWAAGAKLGGDLSYQEKDLVTGQKTVTKLWNAARFALMQLEDYDNKKEGVNVIDKWMLTKLNKLIKNATDSFENYEYAKARADIDQFFWHDLCDNYLEIIKDRIYNPQNYKEGKTGAQYALHKSILAVLKMFAPIMPYITEEVYHLKFDKEENCKSIHISAWPEFDKKEIDEEAEKAGDLAVEIISAVRKFKAEKNLSLKTEIKNLTIETKDRRLIETVLNDIKAATRAFGIGFGKANTQVTPDLKISIELA